MWEGTWVFEQHKQFCMSNLNNFLFASMKSQNDFLGKFQLNFQPEKPFPTQFGANYLKANPLEDYASSQIRSKVFLQLSSTWRSGWKMQEKSSKRVHESRILFCLQAALLLTLKLSPNRSLESFSLRTSAAPSNRLLEIWKKINWNLCELLSRNDCISNDVGGLAYWLKKKF